MPPPPAGCPVRAGWSASPGVRTGPRPRELPGRSGARVRADVAAEPDVMALFAAADEMGRLTAAVANAGIVGRRARLDEMDADRMRRLLETNVLGVMLTAREAVRRMSRATGGTEARSSPSLPRPAGWARRGSTSTTPPARERLTPSPSVSLARSPARGSGSTPSVPASSIPRSTRAVASRTGPPASPPRSRCSGPAAPTRWPRPSSGSSATSPRTRPAPSWTSAAGAERERAHQRQTAVALPPRMSPSSVASSPAWSSARR